MSARRFPVLRSTVAFAVTVLCIGAVLPGVALAAKPAKPKPDLVVTSSVPTTINATTAVTGFNVGVRANTANVPGGTVTKVYLSKDAKVDRKDVVVAATRMTAIKLGKVATVTVKPVVPTTLSGRLFVLVCADSTSKVAEARETNNCARRAAVTVDVVAPVATHASWIEGTPDSLAVNGSVLVYRTGVVSTATAQFSVTDQGLGVTTASTGAGYTATLNAAGAAVSGEVGSRDFELTVTDAAGNSSVTGRAPTRSSGTITGNAIAVARLSQQSLQVPFTFTPGTSVAGVVGWQLLRATAPLVGSASCGAYGEYAPIGTANPASPYTDTVPGDGCYRYALTSTDAVGRVETRTDSSTVRVETFIAKPVA